MSEFKLFDRFDGDTVLFIPGWAADYRIFNTVDLGSNYLMPIKFSPFNFEEGLLKAMSGYRIDKISIIGWSMGGFVAYDLLSKCSDKITDITFVSVRKGYTEQEIKSTRVHLKKNKEAFLYRFYNNCFSKEEKTELSIFKKGLLKSYLNEMDMDMLLEGLQYLSNRRILPRILSGVKIRFIHGEEDKIAPLKEVLELKNELPTADLITIKGAGHMPFLNKDFKEMSLT